MSHSFLGYKKKKFKDLFQEWKIGSAVENACCTFMRTGVQIPALMQKAQYSANACYSSFGDPTPSSFSHAHNSYTHCAYRHTHTKKYWLNIFYVYEWFPYMYVSAPDAHPVSPEVRRECWIPSALSNWIISPASTIGMFSKYTQWSFSC